MKLLRFEVMGATLFAESTFALDLFATDRVAKEAEGEVSGEVSRIGESGSIYGLNVIGLTGVNASGKTTILNLLRFVLAQLTGMYDMREFRTPQQRLGKLGQNLLVKAVFFHDGSHYLVESALDHKTADARALGVADGVDLFTYTDETIWKLTSSRVNRTMLSDTEAFKKNAAVYLQRNGGEGSSRLSDEARTFLNDRTSIATYITNKVTLTVELAERDLPKIAMPTEVVQAFDGSIERLNWDAEAQVYHLQFKGEEERVVGAGAAETMLSRGTVYGSELVEHAIEVLRDGGYLIVDEIEESLNRSLVSVVIDLFSSPVTNPHGAQLVFSTHYPELLDSVRRKDAVYILVRDDNYRTEVIKYSDRVERIENKKSVVILNNVIRGSMPRYPDVQAMREYVRRCVNE